MNAIVKLSAKQERRLAEAERDRARREREYILITAPTIEAYLRITQRAVLRSLDGAGVLTAALDDDMIEQEVLDLMELASENLNPRLRSEPFTRDESSIIWFAVIGALLALRGASVPPQLTVALQSNQLPIATYDIVRKLESNWSSGEIPSIDALRKEIESTLQLPRKTASIIAREMKSLAPPDVIADTFAKAFEGTVIEISRSVSTMIEGIEKMEKLRQRGVERKQWASIWLDDRVRPSHMAAHGQVQAVENTFYVGDSRLMYPGDPAGTPQEVINCRCVLIEVD